MIKKINRKEYPIYSGVLKYFPDALLEVAHVSFIANQQHNPGTETHWDKSKSKDEPDALLRHLIDHTKGDIYDSDGLLHLSKVAWRGLSNLQRYLENEKK